MSGRLEGRPALVTGASQGLGRVIRRALRAGGRAGRAGRPLARAARGDGGGDRGAGGQALVAPTDLGQPAQIDALARLVEAEVGVLDTIVANSGIAGPTDLQAMFHCSALTLAAVEGARRVLHRTARARRDECLTYRCDCTFTTASGRHSRRTA
jgi:NAD(P)-dependent dehydrogenase (short-subunit alcohol dehydrogenase family)